MLARAYYNNEEYDTAIRYAEKALRISEKNSDETLYINASLIIIDSYCWKAEYERAINIYEKIENMFDVSMFGNTLALIGDAYVYTGQREKASNVCDLAYKHNSLSLISLRSEIAANSGDYKTAYINLKTFSEMNDSALLGSLNQNFAQALSDHYSFSHRLLEMKIERGRQWRIFILTGMVMLIAIMSYIAFKKYRRQQEIIEKNLEIAENLRDILSIQNDRLDKAQKNIRELFVTRFAEIDSLCCTVYENTPKSKKHISDKIEKLIHDLSSDPERIAELQAIADKAYDNIVTRFREDFPNVKDADFILFLYTLLGFSNIAIALFLKEEKVMAVYNRKNRLKKKIKEIGEERAKAYLDLL